MDRFRQKVDGFVWRIKDDLPNFSPAKFSATYIEPKQELNLVDLTSQGLIYGALVSLLYSLIQVRQML